MKIKFEADLDGIKLSSPHGEYIPDGDSGTRMVDFSHPACGFERIAVRVDAEDMDVIDDPTLYDRIRQLTDSEVDESDSPELAAEIRASSKGYVTADGGDYSLV